MIIIPSSSLCAEYQVFSRITHETGEPIFITQNGAGDSVLISIEAYDELRANSGNTLKKASTKTKQKEASEMTEYLLGRVLKEMYASANRGEQAANIHLFAIYYASAIVQEKLNKKEILRIAALPESYQTEIAKGINLAKFVVINDAQSERIKKIQDSINELL